ncbi:hypothetical protein KJ590_00655, partial [Patescibacteria group bacterium]|nr:hypothetical protein [Patescibacteria group bacterium]
MVFFFYGADGYRLRQKTNSVIEQYQAKHKSGLNFSRFDFGESEALDKLKNFLDSSPMFAEKKLAIAENLFSASGDKQERFVAYLENSDILKSQDKFLVVAQELAISEDKKSKQEYVLKDSQELFKALVDVSAGALAKAEEFDYLTGAKLEAWIKKETESAGAKIDTGAIRKLAAFVGADLWQM